MLIDNKQLENALIICPNAYKEKILESFREENTIINASFMSLEDYKRNLLFDYDVRAIKHLVEKGYSPANSKELIENMYYVEDKSYNNQKLDLLVEFKKELENKGLLIHNNLFDAYLKQKNIVIIGYGELSKSDLRLFENKPYKSIKQENKQKHYVINSFSDIEAEVEFVYNCVYNLLEKGIDINSIYVCNANSDYESYFKRYNQYYGFSIDYDNGSYLYGTQVAQDFIEMLDKNTREEIYDYLTSHDSKISNKLINILNNYVGLDLKENKELIINDIKTIQIQNNKKNVVKCTNINDSFNDDEYVFLIGFNDKVPNVKTDIDYISDNIKNYVDLETTDETNNRLKNNFINHVSNINNLTLTYCEMSAFASYNKQIILNDCEYINNDSNYDYSEKLNKNKYSEKLDKLRKYNTLSDNVDVLHNVYGRNNYLNYNNKFKGISDCQKDNITSQINKRNKDKLVLSYSSMNSYFECAFKYYLDSVLKVREPFGNYYTKLGTVCHGVLQDLFEDKDFEFESSWNKQIKKEEEKENCEIFEDESEKHFVNRIKEELRQDVEIIIKQKQNSLLDKQKCENNFNVRISDNLEFTGFIDKLMYKETDDDVLAAIVDYKTSKEINIDKEIMKYGLSLQLPSYLFLMKYAPNFNKEVKFAGFYIQHLINYDRKYRNDEDLNQIKEESMKLDGISSISPDRMEALDLSLEEGQKSQSIKGISINKDGTLRKSAKLYTDEEFNELINIVENQIKTAGEAILNGDFKINPKEINGENMSCRYCKYAAICYKRLSDLEFINTEEDQ